MLEQASILIFIVIALALIFDFVNGFHDTANAIATCVSTRAVSPAVAIIMSAILNFAGAMISTGVAKTIGGDIVQSASMVNEVIIIAALAGAIIWNLITWWFGMPSSSSHALVGGIIGAVIISVGFMGLNGYGILKIFLSLVLSPLAAMAIGWIILHIIFAICHSMRPATVNDNCNRLQVISAALMAFAHGSNDAQKSMGSFPKLKIPHQSHADFCSTDTAGGLDNKKRRYAPRGGVAYRLFLWGFPKGATPPFGTRLCEAKCSVLYALPCRENAVAAGEGKGI